MSRFLTTRVDAAAIDAPRARLVLAHGAGAAMTSPFMMAMADALARAGIETTRFEFDYMARRRVDGVKRPPPKIEDLVTSYDQMVSQIAAQPALPLFIGGKSMGGRVASLIADRLYQSGAIRGLVCLGYPFHPPRAPLKLRVAHLATLTCPALIVQGDRDLLGNRADVKGYQLSAAIDVEWLPDGDHDFKPRLASGHTQSGHIRATAAHIARFCNRHTLDTTAPRC